MDLFETKLFFFVGTLVFKQFVAVKHSLYRRITVILFMSFRNGFQKLSADVDPIAATFGFFYFVVTLMAISHQIETGVHPVQELFRIFSSQGGSVIVENDGI